jgi:hypothetical protein
MDRRSFVGGAGATSALRAKPIVTGGLQEKLKVLGAEKRSVRFGEDELLVPDSGWRMWPDQQAAWKEDTIYLPDDVHLDRLLANLPTGGWGASSAKQGIRVELPSTVEQYFWGLQGLRPYQEEYKFETTKSHSTSTEPPTLPPHRAASSARLRAEDRRAGPFQTPVHRTAQSPPSSRPGAGLSATSCLSPHGCGFAGVLDGVLVFCAATSFVPGDAGGSGDEYSLPSQGWSV